LKKTEPVVGFLASDDAVFCLRCSLFLEGFKTPHRFLLAGGRREDFGAEYAEDTPSSPWVPQSGNDGLDFQGVTEKIHILFVDDDTRTREGYREFFELKGFSVQTAADGATALDMVSANPPGVMILDLELPFVDGWEVTRRSKLFDPKILVVSFTGHSSPSERASAARAGCDLYVSKPSPDLLLRQVNKLLVKQTTLRW
jgi:CheY-like chemotaxis protein